MAAPLVSTAVIWTPIWLKLTMEGGITGQQCIVPPATKPVRVAVIEGLFEKCEIVPMPPTAVPVPPEIMSVPPLNPPLTPPANEILSAVRACVIEDVLPVVFPSAVKPIEVAETAPEIISVLPENPPLTPPVNEILSSVIRRVVADDDPVVLPNAVKFIVTALAAVVPVPPEIIKTPFVSNPTEAAPIPETENSESVLAKEDVAEVVFPRAKRFWTVPAVPVAASTLTVPAVTVSPPPSNAMGPFKVVATIY
jgi:hypothetical protein